MQKLNIRDHIGNILDITVISQFHVQDRQTFRRQKKKKNYCKLLYDKNIKVLLDFVSNHIHRDNQ